MRHFLRTKGMFLLAGGVTALLVGPFLIPVPPLVGTVPPKELADEDSEFVEINGVELHVKRMGQGEPVFILLHGFGASLYSWQRVQSDLSQLGTVIAYDRPGFGLSERPLSWSGQNPYSPQAQVEQVIGLLDHFGVQQAILVGSSAGGTVALQAALEYPRRVVALILVDAAVYLGGGAPAGLNILLGTPQMRHLGPLIARRLVSRAPDILKFAWHNPDLLPHEILEDYQKPFQVQDWDTALWEVMQASRPAGLARRLGEVTQPSLVITGDDDRIVPTAESIRLAKELAHSHLEIISNCGHLPHEEQPVVFMEAVTRFVKEFLP